MNAGIILKIVKFFKVPYGGTDVDFVDQLNYQFTSGLLAVFVILIGFRQYVGKPIQCWVPQEFTKAWEEYAENLCWVQNTYLLLADEEVPVSELELARMRYIGYYQWVAIVLSGQALISWLPHLLWRVFSGKVVVLLRSAREAAVPDWAVRRRAVVCLVNALEEQSHINTQYYRNRNRGNSSSLGGSGLLSCLNPFNPACRVTMVFVLVRLLFITNCLAQILIMRLFIGYSDSWFGYNVFQDLLRGSNSGSSYWDQQQQSHLPRSQSQAAGGTPQRAGAARHPQSPPVIGARVHPHAAAAAGGGASGHPPAGPIGRGVDGPDSPVGGGPVTFPRVTYCTVRVRKVGQLKPGSYTLQCVLPINYFIEKVYVFLWFWFVILGVLTIISTGQWIINICIPPFRVQFIRQYLKALKMLSGPEERECERFVNRKLGCDGVFLLAAVSRLSSDLIALDVAGQLWSNFRRARTHGGGGGGADGGGLEDLIQAIHRSPHGAGVDGSCGPNLV